MKWVCTISVSCTISRVTTNPPFYHRTKLLASPPGMKKLSNEKKGELYGVSKSWSPAKRRGVGLALLYKAHLTLLNEGHREITQADITSWALWAGDGPSRAALCRAVRTALETDPHAPRYAALCRAVLSRDNSVIDWEFYWINFVVVWKLRVKHLKFKRGFQFCLESCCYFWFDLFLGIKLLMVY